MKHYFIIIGWVFLTGLLNAQMDTNVLNIVCPENIKKGENTDLYFLCHETDTNHFEEDDYLSSQWVEIQVINEENKHYTIPGRYRMADSRFEFQFNNKTCELYPHFTKAVFQGQDVFVPFLTDIGEIQDYQFFQLISAGKVNLLKKVNKSKSSTKLYFQKGNQKRAYQLKKKKKVILDLLKDKSSSIDSFVKEHGLDYANTSDLIRIFDFYNGK